MPKELSFTVKKFIEIRPMVNSFLYYSLSTSLICVVNTDLIIKSAVFAESVNSHDTKHYPEN